MHNKFQHYEKQISVALILGLVGLSSFSVKPLNYEQLTFDHFISDILTSDFKDVTTIEFKGKTEDTFSTLDDYKICLKPEEKLQSLLKKVTTGPTNNVKTIRYEQIKTLTITDFKSNSNAPKLYIYPALRVADSFYVFLILNKLGEPATNYIFEISTDGKGIRSCRMNY